MDVRQICLIRSACAVPATAEGRDWHDLRHRMAVNNAPARVRDGVDVERHLPDLATYLVHAHITDT